jgi:hypothetical protein
MLGIPSLTRNRVRLDMLHAVLRALDDLGVQGVLDARSCESWR